MEFSAVRLRLWLTEDYTSATIVGQFSQRPKLVLNVLVSDSLTFVGTNSLHKPITVWTPALSQGINQLTAFIGRNHIITIRFITSYLNIRKFSSQDPGALAIMARRSGDSKRFFGDSLHTAFLKKGSYANFSGRKLPNDKAPSYKEIAMVTKCSFSGKLENMSTAEIADIFLYLYCGESARPPEYSSLSLIRKRKSAWMIEGRILQQQ
ncbi:hypothetical protein ACTXT7_007622 [Hymenolepis weldensis]